MSTAKSYEDYVKNVLKVADPEKLSKFEKQKNRTEYQKYIANHSAEQNKNKTISALEQDRDIALSDSAIASERARKYVDAVNKHYGIAGTGYGESKAIDLYSEEAKRRAEINDAYANGKNEALTAYQNAVTQNELVANNKLAEIEGYEDEENEIKKATEKQQKIAIVQEALNNPDISDAELKTVIDESKGYLDEKENAALINTLNKKSEEINLNIKKKQTIADVASEKGIKLGDTVTLEELDADNTKLGDFKDTGEQGALITKIIELAKMGVLDGKAFDVNYGVGREHWYYKDGIFFDISKSEAEKLGKIDIDDVDIEELKKKNHISRRNDT